MSRNVVWIQVNHVTPGARGPGPGPGSALAQPAGNVPSIERRLLLSGSKPRACNSSFLIPIGGSLAMMINKEYMYPYDVC